MFRLVETRKNGRKGYEIEKRKRFLFFQWWESVDWEATEERARENIKNRGLYDYRRVIETFS